MFSILMVEYIEQDRELLSKFNFHKKDNQIER